MQQFKTYIFRLYPDCDQKKKLNSFLGTTRFIYNHYLDVKENNPSLTFYEMKKDLPNLIREYPWLQEIDGCILRTTIDNLENSYKRYYQK